MARRVRQRRKAPVSRAKHALKAAPAARRGRFWAFDSSGHLRQLNIRANFVSEDTLPRVAQLEPVISPLWVVDAGGEFRQLDSLADFVDENTLAPCSPRKNERAGRDSFSDETTFGFSNTPALCALPTEGARPGRDRQRHVLFAWTALACVVVGVGIAAPRVVGDRPWHPLSGSAIAPSLSSRLSGTEVSDGSPSEAPALRAMTPVPHAEPSRSAGASHRAAPAAKRPAVRSVRNRVPSRRNEAQVATRVARRPERVRSSGTSAVGTLTNAAVLPTVGDIVPLTSGYEGTTLRPLPTVSPSVTRSGDDDAPALVPAGDTRRESDHVRAVLARYQTAYARLDAVAAKEIWPSLDRTALERAFRNLNSQELQFDDCRVTIDASRAVATCTGVARYVTRIGSSSWKTAHRDWTFKLRKDSGAWLIDSVVTR
jgi:hypothetical protein